MGKGSSGGPSQTATLRHRTARVRAKAALGACLLAAALGILFFAQSGTTATTPVAWRIDSSPETVLAGTSKTAFVDVTSSEPLRKVRLTVKPGFVGVQPSSVEAFGPGTLRLTLPIAPPYGRRPGKYDIRLTLKACRSVEKCSAITSHLDFRVKVVDSLPVEIPTAPTNPSNDRIVEDPVTSLLVVKDELLVVVDEENGTAALEAARSVGGRLIGGVPEVGVFQLQVPGAGPSDMESLRPTVEQLDGVTAVSSNVLSFPSERIPNDPEYENWTTNNYHLNLVNAPAAWDRTTGSPSTKLAVIDFGFFDHSDLENADAASEFDSTGRRDDTYVQHGTHVAGIACAQGDNARGVTGVAWDCSQSLLDVTYPLVEPITQQQWGCRGYGPEQTTWHLTSVPHIVAHMSRAVAGGARIVNMSFGIGWHTEPTDSYLPAVQRVNDVYAAAVRDASETADVLWVVAAGNECVDARLQAPAGLAKDFPNVVAVASVGPDGTLAASSNRGDLVEVGAPGVAIHSTTVSCNLFGCGDDYETKSGTSMASPVVAGAAALVLSAHPGLTAVQVKECLLSGPVIPVSDIDDGIIKLLDADAAVACDLSAPRYEERGLACGVLDRDESALITHDSYLVWHASGRVDLLCEAQGTPGDAVVEFSGFACSLAQFGLTTDSTNRIDPDGHITLTCTKQVNPEDVSSITSPAPLGVVG